MVKFQKHSSTSQVFCSGAYFLRYQAILKAHYASTFGTLILIFNGKIFSIQDDFVQFGKIYVSKK